MQINKVLAGCLIDGNSGVDPRLDEKFSSISGIMPIIEQMFPGINYYSVTGFFQVMNKLVRPSLLKLFPDLIEVEISRLDITELVEIPLILASNGYEWEEDEEWQKKFEQWLNTK